MKIDRLIGILSILLQEEKTTAPELAEKFEVSRRTINRDIEDLCKAGIPIRTAQGTGGGISIMDGYCIDRTILTSSVGIVPGKLENREEAIAQIVELLEITPEAIEKKLSAKWVKDDSFVPIKTIPRVEEIELMSISPDEEVLKENERHAHEVVVRPLEDGGVQYVSNQIIPSEDNYEETWHTPRLTLEEWEELYGGE